MIGSLQRKGACSTTHPASWDHQHFDLQTQLLAAESGNQARPQLMISCGVDLPLLIDGLLKDVVRIYIQYKHVSTVLDLMRRLYIIAPSSKTKQD